MHTNRSETRTISIAAPPAAVLDVVGDPHTLPGWAPAFAPAVAPEGRHWRVGDGADGVLIDVRVAREQGTVDLLDVADPRRGAFMRVLPNRDGSELTFTLFFPPDAPEAAVGRQMAVVEEELAAVRALSTRPVA